MLADLKFALRQLAKAPGFTAIALLTLAVGIGSTTVVFSAIDALLFKPLPFLAATEDRLVYAAQTDKVRGSTDRGWSYPDYLAVRERATSLEGIWVHHDRTVIIAGTDKPQRLIGTDITWDAFDLMGVKPIRGRNFSAIDTIGDSDRVALISETLWRRRFQAADDTIGSAVTLNGQPTTIIGVMPEGWRYPDHSQVWTPLRTDDDEKLMQRSNVAYSGRAKLKPGVALATAQAEVDAIAGALAQEFPLTNDSVGIHLRPIREEAVEGTDQFAILLFGAVLFVLLIACVNVANLLLARSGTRTKEIAIRLALGAPRHRVIRQLVTESILLAFLGGIGGLILGLWGNDAMIAALPIEIPFWLRFQFDLRVFAFVCLLSLVAALLFGLVPALRVSRPDVVTELKEGGRTADVSGPRAARLRNLLVVAEIALALILLVGAGLMMRSFLALRRIDPGFDARNVFTFRTGFPVGMVGQREDIPARFFADLLPRLAALPGVESVAITSWRPGQESAWANTFVTLENQPRPSRTSDGLQAFHQVVSSAYFSTLRIPLKAGRTFDDGLDRPDTPPVVIVDERFATQHFGAPANAIGRRLHGLEGKVHVEKTIPFQIIGVVGSVRHQLDKPDERPTFYVSVGQTKEHNFLTVLLKTGADPITYAEPARDTVMAVNREIPIYDDFPLEQLLLRSESVWQLRFFSYLFTVFGLVALFLACIGIYGVMAYSVTQRVQELGVRLALGAEPQHVIRLVIRHGAQLVGWGLAAGLVAAFFLVNLLRGVLYGISPRDPPTFAAVPLLLASVALLACWLSSRRATLIAPNAALRAE